MHLLPGTYTMLQIFIAWRKCCVMQFMTTVGLVQCYKQTILANPSDVLQTSRIQILHTKIKGYVYTTEIFGCFTCN